MRRPKWGLEPSGSLSSSNRPDGSPQQNAIFDIQRAGVPLCARVLDARNVSAAAPPYPLRRSFN